MKKNYSLNNKKPNFKSRLMLVGIQDFIYEEQLFIMGAFFFHLKTNPLVSNSLTKKDKNSFIEGEIIKKASF